MKTPVLLASILFSSGCARPGYFADRLNDSADILSLTVGVGVGGKISAGPLYVNALGVSHRDLAGVRYGDFLISHADSSDSEIGSWFGFGQSYHSRTELQKSRNKAPEYSFTEIPFLMTNQRGADADPLAIDCVLGLGLSVRFGISPLELVDFIFGWTTLDLLQDDISPNSKSEIDNAEVTIRNNQPWNSRFQDAPHSSVILNRNVSLNV